MNKTITIAVMAVFVIGLTATQVNQAKASITGDYGRGYDAGRNAAMNNPNGSASCPIDFFSHISYCTGYHVGFDKEQFLLREAS